LTLVCFALAQEAQPLRPWAKQHPGVQILVTGMGKTNCAAALRPALGRLNPARVLTCGLAGGLHPALAAGRVVFDADAGIGLADKLQALGAVPVRFYCADRVVCRAEEKRRLHETTGAEAVDMESEIVRTLCRERALPSATIRVILDSADEDLPLDWNLVMTADQCLSYPRLAAAVLKAPSRVGAVFRLQQQTRRAAETLAAILRQVLAGGPR
jgi:nucleoside phosphorylase